MVSNLWRVAFDSARDYRSQVTSQLTRGTFNILGHTISPDGNALAISVAVGEELHVFITSVDGTQRRQLTYSGWLNAANSWSPDGRNIVLTRIDEENKFDSIMLCIMDADGGQPRQLAHFQGLKSGDCAQILDWNAGTMLVTETNDCQSLHLIESTTGAQRMFPTSGPEGLLSSPRPANDGEHVAVYWERQEGNPDGIWVIRLSDETARFVASITADPLGWSPDDTWIYFWREIENAHESLIGRVHVSSGEIDTVAILPWVPSPRVAGNAWIDLSKDAAWAVCLVDEDLNDVWLIEDFDLYVE
jgi:Tol biopolymer transport system component